MPKMLRMVTKAGGQFAALADEELAGEIFERFAQNFLPHTVAGEFQGVKFIVKTSEIAALIYDETSTEGGENEDGGLQLDGGDAEQPAEQGESG